MFVVVVVGGDIGAALVQPPKSSSAATVGAGLDDALGEVGAPQPAPRSFAVSLSGSFIMEDEPVVGGVGVGSGVFQALPAPQGSMEAAENMLFGAAAVVVGAAGLGAGGLRLNADFRSCCGEVAMGGGGAWLGAGAGAGVERSNKSFDKDDEGRLGRDGGGDAKLENPMSCLPEDIEVVRD